MIGGVHRGRRRLAILTGMAAAWFSWRGLMARLRGAIQAAIETHAPLGYEDAAGFHFGV
jgi:hypothetical protein